MSESSSDSFNVQLNATVLTSQELQISITVSADDPVIAWPVLFATQNMGNGIPHVLLPFDDLLLIFRETTKLQQRFAALYPEVLREPSQRQPDTEPARAPLALPSGS